MVNVIRSQPRLKVAIGLIFLVGVVVVTLLSNSPTSRPLVRDYWPTEGWRTALPQDHGMDDGALDRLHQHIETDLPNLFSLLIVRDGYLVYERYYEGFYAEFPFEVASVTKSITSALVGIAIDEGAITSLDQKVVEFFPDFQPNSADSSVGQISLRHIMSMTTGFDWSEDGPWYWPRQDSWTEFALNMTPIHPPGKVFTYNTPATHLLSGVLTQATGMSEADYAQSRLFDPLGIAPPAWDNDPDGYTTGAHALNLTAQDMAKFGYLYLNKGAWNGRQIVPQAWAEESTTSHTAGGFPQHTQYGYLWWVTNEYGHQAYFAAGYGGQFVYVMPDLDLVVVMTSDLGDEHPEHRALIGDYIIPATR